MEGDQLTFCFLFLKGSFLFTSFSTGLEFLLCTVALSFVHWIWKSVRHGYVLCLSSLVWNELFVLGVYCLDRVLLLSVCILSFCCLCSISCNKHWENGLIVIFDDGQVMRLLYQGILQRIWILLKSSFGDQSLYWEF